MIRSETHEEGRGGEVSQAQRGGTGPGVARGGGEFSRQPARQGLVSPCGPHSGPLQSLALAGGREAI